MKWLKGLFVLIAVLGIVYLLGPHPDTPKYETVMPVVPEANGLENYIAANEAAHKIKPDNEARVVWANDTTKEKTDYAIVYLHGFSASQGEGDPVHRNIARQFGCNLYLARLAEHGIDTSEQLMNLTADKYWNSARQALAIGMQLGKKVLLMGTSTGGTQALQLAAAYPKEVSALVLYSPNIAIFDPLARLVNNPWGLQLARFVKGSNYIVSEDKRAITQRYWNNPYRLEATVALEEMLETSMKKETFEKIKQPTLLLYYYKDEIHQDSVVSVTAMKNMFGELGTAAVNKRAIPLPNTGNHVIASPIKSKDFQSVERETRRFLEEVLHLQAKK